MVVSMQGYPASVGWTKHSGGEAFRPYLVADNIVWPPELTTADVLSEELLLMPYSYMGCGYNSSVASTTGRRSKHPYGGDTASRVWLHGKSIRSRRGDSRDRDAHAPKTTGASPSPPLHHARSSWVQEEERWEARLEEQKVRQIVDQVHAILRRSPTLAAPARLRTLGLEVIDDEARKGASNDGHHPGKMASRVSSVGGGGVVCANNRLSKVDPAALTVWSNVMRRLPETASIRFDGQFPDALANVLGEAKARGLQTSRVVAKREASYENYMQMVENCTVLLDTLSYSGHTVGLDALYHLRAIVIKQNSVLADIYLRFAIPILKLILITSRTLY
jgi:hypothetical protein